MYEDKEQQVAVKKMKAEAMSLANQADFDREIKTMLVRIAIILAASNSIARIDFNLKFIRRN